MGNLPLCELRRFRDCDPMSCIIECGEGFAHLYLSISTRALVNVARHCVSMTRPVKLLVLPQPDTVLRVAWPKRRAGTERSSGCGWEYGMCYHSSGGPTWRGYSRMSCPQCRERCGRNGLISGASAHTNNTKSPDFPNLRHRHSGQDELCWVLWL